MAGAVCEEKSYLFLHEPPSTYTNLTNVLAATSEKQIGCKKTYMTLEAAGPLLLAGVYAFSLGTFITALPIATMDADNLLFHRLGGFLHKIKNGQKEDTVGQILMKVVDTTVPTRKARALWARWHGIIAFILAVPYSVVPFIVRYNHNCLVFWHWDMEVNIVIYAATILNLYLPYKFMHILLHAFYLFRQKYIIVSKVHKMLYDDDEDVEYDIELFSCHSDVVGWFLISSGLSRVKEKILLKFNTMITGLALCFIIWMGFFYSMRLGGWANDSDGMNITYLAAYTVLMCGSYLMFPIMSYGIAINMVIDKTKARLHDCLWIASSTKATNSDLWSTLIDRYESRTEYLKILWVIVLSPDILKSVVILTLTTAISAVYSEATKEL